MHIYPVKVGAEPCNLFHVQHQPTFYYLLITVCLVSMNCAGLEQAMQGTGFPSKP